MMNDNDWLDKAIDEVARELTDREPRPGFAGQIAKRLEQPERRRIWAWQLAGAAAILAVIVFAMSRPSNEPGRPASDASASRTGPQVQSVPSSATAPPVSDARPGAPKPGAARSRPTAMARVAIDADAPRIPALPELTELQVHVQGPETLAVAALGLRDLDVMPLTPDDKEPR
jgi:hypothetical protein